MTRAVPATQAAGRLALLGIGEFGEHVVALMRRAARRPVLIADGVTQAFRSDTAAVVVAMWRPCPKVCEQADALAFGSRRPWLPVVMDHPHIRVGPLVVPGHGVCFACFQARCAQHDSQRDVTAALHAAYDRDPDFGPCGYLDHHARLAAALAGLALGDLRDDKLATVAGHALSFNVCHGTGIRRHRVAPRPGCSRCAGPASARDRPLLAELLQKIAAERAARSATDGEPRRREIVDDR